MPASEESFVQSQWGSFYKNVEYKVLWELREEQSWLVRCITVRGQTYKDVVTPERSEAKQIFLS